MRVPFVALRAEASSPPGTHQWQVLGASFDWKAERSSAVSAMPPQIQLPASPLPPNYSYPVGIRNNGSQTFTVSDAKVNVEGVTVKIQEATPGKLFNVVLTFPSDFKMPAGQPIELSAKTSHLKYPLVRVPVVQTPPTVAPAVFTPPATITVKPGDAGK